MDTLPTTKDINILMSLPIGLSSPVMWFLRNPPSRLVRQPLRYL
jgi:hypothetical protein